MARSQDEKSVADFNAVRLTIASREDILAWSYGEVLKPETINYRTQKPERDGLFCERIFGPVKDINSNDAKLKGVRSREAAVDKNGELVTKSSARRERMARSDFHPGIISPSAPARARTRRSREIGALKNPIVDIPSRKTPISAVVTARD